MFTKSILTTAAIALVAGLGSASAGEQFTTIADLSAQALSADELAEVRGAGDWTVFTGNGTQLFESLMSDDVSNRICGFDSCFVRMGRPEPNFKT